MLLLCPCCLILCLILDLIRDQNMESRECMNSLFQKRAGILFTNVQIKTTLILLPAGTCCLRGGTCHSVQREALPAEALGTPSTPAPSRPLWALTRAGADSPAQSVHSAGHIFPTGLLRPLCPKPTWCWGLHLGPGLDDATIAPAWPSLGPCGFALPVPLCVACPPRPAPHLDHQVSSPVGLGLCSAYATKGPNGNRPTFSCTSHFLHTLSRCTKSWASRLGVDFYNRCGTAS